MVDRLFSLTMGREELSSVNSKTVAVLHVGRGGAGKGDEFLARAAAGAGQDGGCLVVIY